MTADRSQARQLIASLAAALAIAAIVIVAVTLRLGPTSIAELEAREDRREAIEDRREDRREAREERREDRRR